MTTDPISSGLLPEGLRDALPPSAHHAEQVVRRLLDHFAANGYDLVAPPLLEFEAGLRGRLDAGQGNSSDAFHLLDPVSQRPMLVRSDITRQVARIATTRMADAPRPLRLAYTGSALRTRGTQLRPSRQVRQVGVELIGNDSLLAAKELAEVVSAAFDVLGLENLTFDVSFPGFVPVLCRALGLSGEQANSVRAALDDKDAGAVASVQEPARSILLGLMTAVGRPSEVVANIAALNLPDEARALWQEASALTDVLASVVGPDRLHVDPAEVHGFSYQAGWALSVFGGDMRGELGKGGAYALTGQNGDEPAQGFTFYPDVFAEHVSKSSDGGRVLVAPGAGLDDVRALQKGGYVTLRALTANLDQEARAARCTQIFDGGTLRPAPRTGS